LIVTETNLIQRSFADLSHSERAYALSTHYEAMKKNPGYRSDLLAEIEEATRVPLAPRSRTANKLGEQHGLSSDTIKRYLRVDKLIQKLKDRLDDNNIGLRVAVSLSFLRDSEQKIIDKLLGKGQKISIGQAEALKNESKKGQLDESAIKKILEPATRLKPVKLGGQFLSQYFKEGQSPEEIESIIAEALGRYYSDSDQ